MNAEPSNSELYFYCDKPYKDYPINHTIYPGGAFLLEGYIYNVNIKYVNGIIYKFISGEINTIGELNKIVSNWSGEWCCWIVKNNTLYFLNDPLGRLPVYYFENKDYFFAGRHLSILSSLKLLIPNKYGAASFLWSGYIIGNNTLYNDVKRFPGNSHFHIDLHNSEIKITQGAHINFDNRSEATLSNQVNTLKELFFKSCAQIAATTKMPINISLSGGQDSRAAAVGFSKSSKQNLYASSFVKQGSEKDALIAEKIATALNIPFQKYHINNVESDMQELLHQKMGMNYIGMSFIINFYKQLLKHYSQSIYVTGDGGDKALPYLGENRKTGLSLDKLILLLSKRHAITPIDKVASIMGLNPDDILQMIYKVVSHYPEQKINNKSIHFAIYERAFQCYSEGEDRSRFYFWATTPFYDLDFFKSAMLVPDRYKKHYYLYRLFQNQLSKKIADIPDANGYSINSYQFKLYKTVQESFRSTSPVLKNLMRRLGGKSLEINNASVTEKENLIYLLLHSKELSSIFNTDYYKTFLSQSNQEQYKYLRTLTLISQFFKK